MKGPAYLGNTYWDELATVPRWNIDISSKVDNTFCEMWTAMAAQGFSTVYENSRHTGIRWEKTPKNNQAQASRMEWDLMHKRFRFHGSNLEIANETLGVLEHMRIDQYTLTLSNSANLF